MDQHLEDKNTRNQGLVDFRNTNLAIIAAKAGLDLAWTKFIGLHTEVNSKIRLAQPGFKGKTASKFQAEADLLDPTLLIAGAIYSLGRDTNNPELENDFNFLAGTLEKMRDTEYLNLTKRVLSTANLHIVELAQHDITPEILSAYETKIMAFENAMGKRITGEKQYQQAVDAIAELMGQMDEVIKKDLNKRMLTLKAAHPEIYDEYVRLRKITTTGVRHEPEPTNNPGQPPTQ